MSDEHCKAPVFHAGMFTSTTCSRRAKRDGYCKQHHPESVAAHKAQAEAKWRAEREANARRYRYRQKRNDVAEAAVALVDDINNYNVDPTGVFDSSAWERLESAVTEWKKER